MTSSQQVCQWHAGDTSHLHVVDDAHELVEEAQRQVGVLQAVDGQTTPRLVVAVLGTEKEYLMLMINNRSHVSGFC